MGSKVGYTLVAFQERGYISYTFRVEVVIRKIQKVQTFFLTKVHSIQCLFDFWPERGWGLLATPWTGAGGGGSQ